MKYWRRKEIIASDAEVTSAVSDPLWQTYLSNISDLSTVEQLIQLDSYLKGSTGSREDLIRVDNYITQLFRAKRLRRICNELLVVVK